MANQHLEAIWTDGSNLLIHTDEVSLETLNN